MSKFTEDLSKELGRRKIMTVEEKKEKAEKIGKEMTVNASKCGVPYHLIPGLVRYIAHGIPTGAFLAAVLSNDLMEAFSQADEESSAGMKELCTFLYTYAPSGCKGSPLAVKTWVLQRGLEGMG